MIAIAKQFIPWAILIAFAGVVYYVAVAALQDRGPTAAFQAYLDCIRKVNTYEWEKVPGGKPGTAGEICKNIQSGR